MKDYLSKPLVYLAVLTGLTAYSLAGTESSYAAERPKSNTISIYKLGRSWHIGVNGKNRNITHDVQSNLIKMERKKFELQNKLRNYEPPIRIKVRTRR